MWASQHSLAGREAAMYEMYHYMNYAIKDSTITTSARSLMVDIPTSSLQEVSKTVSSSSRYSRAYVKANLIWIRQLTTVNKQHRYRQSEANIKKLQTQALAEWVAQQIKQLQPPDDSQAPTVASSPETKRKPPCQKAQANTSHSRPYQASLRQQTF